LSILLAVLAKSQLPNQKETEIGNRHPGGGDSLERELRLYDSGVFMDCAAEAFLDVANEQRCLF
jgi:hypothetical protein